MRSQPSRSAAAALAAPVRGSRASPSGRAGGARRRAPMRTSTPGQGAGRGPPRRRSRSCRSWSRPAGPPGGPLDQLGRRPVAAEQDRSRKGAPRAAGVASSTRASMVGTSETRVASCSAATRSTLEAVVDGEPAARVPAERARIGQPGDAVQRQAASQWSPDPGEAADRFREGRAETARGRRLDPGGGQLHALGRPGGPRGGDHAAATPAAAGFPSGGARRPPPSTRWVGRSRPAGRAARRPAPRVERQDGLARGPRRGDRRGRAGRGRQEDGDQRALVGGHRHTSRGHIARGGGYS